MSVILTVAFVGFMAAPISADVDSSQISKVRGSTIITEAAVLVPLDGIERQTIWESSYYMFEFGAVSHMSKSVSLGMTMTCGYNFNSKDFLITAELRSRTEVYKNISAEISVGVPLPNTKDSLISPDLFIQTGAFINDVVGFTVRAEKRLPRNLDNGFTEYYGGIKIGKRPGLILGVSAAAFTLIIGTIFVATWDYD